METFATFARKCDSSKPVICQLTALKIFYASSFVISAEKLFRIVAEIENPLKSVRDWLDLQAGKIYNGTGTLERRLLPWQFVMDEHTTAVLRRSRLMLVDWMSSCYCRKVILI